ncbi:biotin/lipoyl-containing protein [Gimesia panareensis]|uniref:Dihydrolipoamide succinyltransferase n=1 Tax=Gimesia panareensis TaxID=2527978 RepID=A0A518AAM8_9PLAN|nr:biotin/lipoyl-containing protein [Gimesia panareensis]QDT28918.1 dihydrolipoamide succinyltransferase [Gimesia panareensis]QDU51764.1 dihydrolipoamide succinyltransferase [Gimesia panareensis]
MSTPILVPQLESDDQRLSVSLWLMRVGEEVTRGDRIVELLVPGVTFDVAAPCSGTLTSCDCRPGDEVHEGSVLGWIDSPESDQTADVDDSRLD